MTAKLTPQYLQIETADITALANPAAGSFVIALDSGNSNKLTRKDSSGTETVIEGGGGGTMSSFIVSGDTGIDQTISDGNTLEIVGGTGIDTVASDTDTLTINIDSTVATLTGTQSLTNKTLDNTNTITVLDANFTVQDNADPTKQAKLQASGITTGTTRTFTLPDTDDTFVVLALAQTLTNKTLTAPKINLIADTNGNEAAIFVTTASAVNEITVTNAATGSGPSITATGGDTDIDLNIGGKGAGNIKAATPLDMNDLQILKSLYVDFKRGTAPADPAAGYLRAYALDSDGHLYQRDSSGTATDLTTGGGGGGYATIQEDGTGLTQRTTANFIGPLVTAVDNAGSTKTDIYLHAPLFGGRLSASSTLHTPTADLSAVGTLYYLPCTHQYVPVYDGTRFRMVTISGLSLALTLTADKLYDAFVRWNSGTPDLVLSAAWTNDTTRADALGTREGIPVLNSDNTYTHLGAIRASGTNTIEDSKTKRFVSNLYNRRRRVLSKFITTASWTYGTSSWRQANADTANKVEFINCADDDSIMAAYTAWLSGVAANNIYVGIGLDSTSALASDAVAGVMSGAFSLNISSGFNGWAGLGYHYLAALEYATATGTFFGVGNSNNTTRLSGDIMA